MSAYKPSGDQDSQPLSSSREDTRNPQDKSALADYFLTKYQPELSIPYVRNWGNGDQDQED
jgi:hypothetical protein